MVKVQEDSHQSYLSDEKAVKKFVKSMLKNHTFIGNYVEQRYVPELRSYKKVVKISNNEEIFIENLSIAKRRIENFFGDTKWLGITFPNTLGAPVGVHLWVDFDENILGTYKFLVKDIKFTETEIFLKIQIIEPSDGRPSFSDSSLSRTNHNNRHKNSSFGNEYETFVENISPVFTWGNAKGATLFMFFFITALVTGSAQIIMFLMDYTLKLLRELSHVISVTTPIIVACFDSISRMFGYVCVLIGLLWRDRHSPPKLQVVNPNRLHYHYQPAYPYENRYKALPYKPQNSVQITEIMD